MIGKVESKLKNEDKVKPKQEVRNDNIIQILTKKENEIADDKKDSSNNNCLICFEKESDAVLMECGHGGICQDCARNLCNSNGMCHLCREVKLKNNNKEIRK